MAPREIRSPWRRESGKAVLSHGARKIALTALRLWRKEKRFADSIISGLSAKAALTPSDRAFALELFYGVLRNLTLLDFWVSCLRASRVESDLRDILRLGLYQLFLLKTAQHAAVHETVELAPKSQRTIINAMLRAATRQRSDLLARAWAQPLFVRTSHPQFLVERWLQHFGLEQAEKLCEWNNLPAPVYARVNLLRIDRTEFLRRYPESRPLPDNPNFVEIDSFPSDALERGHCYIQDPSTAIACQLLDPKPGERILDACAAPGGKTGYIAQLMENAGTIVACDRDPERLQILKENMARLGVGNVRILRHDWTQGHVPSEIASVALFDRILIDAPCTNTGVMRRRVDLRWRLRRIDFVRMQQRQIEIVRRLIPLLKLNGVLVYSTCSLEPEENEEVVRRILAETPALRLQAQKHSLPFRDGFDGAFAARLTRSA
ncbi:MAG: 16S rRNA (cytosine(967)-C(5))-methyltransferase [Verrucomicrobia bacterium]|nr:MAG: 16S rRNA (cytosine(967)-C(5))-methyltransferase [Verrucomicrobiota bacterium]